MNKVEMNKSMKLSEHFTLGEMCKTKYVTADGNIPSHVVIENLKRICGWLEELRVLAGVRPQSKVLSGVRPQSKVAGDCTLAPDPRGCALRGAKDVRQTQEGGARFRENPIPVYGFSSCGSGIIFLPLQQKSEVEPI